MKQAEHVKVSLVVSLSLLMFNELTMDQVASWEYLAL